MSKSWTWLALIGLPVLLLLGWIFINATSARLHPDPADIPSAMVAAPAAKYSERVARAQQIIRASLSEQNLPGISVAVGAGGEIAWAEGFGFADLKTSVPVTPNHRFRIGSASTVLTSAAAGVLLEKGRLKLDDEIQTYVPEFPRKAWPVTVRGLMGHTAGVVTDGGDEGPLFTKRCGRPAEALPNFSDKALLFEPGSQYRFSNYGWILLSAAIEAAAKQPFLTFIRDEVFDPLGMRDTVPDVENVDSDDDFPLVNLFRELVHDPKASRKSGAAPGSNPAGADRVSFYFPRFAADPKHGLHLMRPLDYSCYAGASVFVTTPSDLVRFGMAIRDGKLLKPETVQLLQTPQRLASGKETGYGLGWDLETVSLAGKQMRVAGHDGNSLGGMVASLVTLPEQGIVVAVVSNISYADTFTVATKIAEAFLMEPAGIPGRN